MQISHSMLSCIFWEVGCDALAAAALPASSSAFNNLSKDEIVGKMGVICIYGSHPYSR